MLPLNLNLSISIEIYNDLIYCNQGQENISIQRKEEDLILYQNTLHVTQFSDNLTKLRISIDRYFLCSFDLLKNNSLDAVVNPKKYISEKFLLLPLYSVSNFIHSFEHARNLFPCNTYFAGLGPTTAPYDLLCTYNVILDNQLIRFSYMVIYMRDL